VLACLSIMLMGNQSIDQIFFPRVYFNAVSPIQVSMTKNALEDLTGCLHYSDDWEVLTIGMVHMMMSRLKLMYQLHLIN
jgi:hypothetical protein